MHEALQALVERSVISSLAAFALTFGAVLLLRPFALRFGLVDKPGGRKIHAVATPAIGGAAVLLGSLPLAIATFELTWNLLGLAAGGAIVIALGILDDLHDIRWCWRLLGQAGAALLMISMGGVRVEQLGPIFGYESLQLGVFSVPFTVLATVGLMNALNMVDGIDGLAGMVTAAALAMFTAAAVYSGNVRLSHGLVILLGAITAFLAFNLRTPWRARASIFLGNAGSEFLGLVLAWCCFRLTQNPHHPIAPVLAPFLLAPPVIDCLVLAARRIRSKRSPFAADRNHLHHLLLDAGWSSTAAVLGIIALCFSLGLAAALALLVDVSPTWLVIAFAALTVAYYLVSAQRVRCVAFLHAVGRFTGACSAVPHQPSPSSEDARAGDAAAVWPLGRQVGERRRI